MISLTSRLLISASVVLVSFLGLTGLALDYAFRESALVTVQDRLQAYIYMVLSAADIDEENNLMLPAQLPETRFSTPGSGLYAGIVNSSDKVVWRSPSLLGMTLPFTAVPTPGESFFSELNEADVNPLLALNFTVKWEFSPDEGEVYTFWVAETRQIYNDQVKSFRRNLWIWLLAPLLGLLAVQGIILRWGLKPLRQVAREVEQIEAGAQAELAGPYPAELQALTANLNQLIKHSRSHLERYRNALGDLAHSLKTPLAVLRSALESPASASSLKQTLEEQLERMNQTVDYQLSRAAASGRIALATPVSVKLVADKIIASLGKVYADKSLTFEMDIDAELVFYGDQGDLMEILGNLADNACKWACSTVAVRAQRADTPLQQTFAMLLQVEDDGNGIPAEKQHDILGRGQRADPDTSGHGIGLAVVRELVEDIYGGTLEIATAELGGACVRIKL